MKSDPRILLTPHPNLSKPSTEIALDRFEDIRSDLQILADYLVEICAKVEAVGMAAPQVGANVRMIVLNTKEIGSNLPGPLVMLNPSWSPYPCDEADGLEVSLEKCFSTPGISIPISRHKVVHAYWTGLDGKPDFLPLEGLAARVIQHECDHLEGKCLYDRLTPEQRKIYEDATESNRRRVNPNGRRHPHRRQR